MTIDSNLAIQYILIVDQLIYLKSLLNHFKKSLRNYQAVC